MPSDAAIACLAAPRGGSNCRGRQVQARVIVVATTIDTVGLALARQQRLSNTYCYASHCRNSTVGHSRAADAGSIGVAHMLFVAEVGGHSSGARAIRVVAAPGVPACALLAGAARTALHHHLCERNKAQSDFSSTWYPITIFVRAALRRHVERTGRVT